VINIISAISPKFYTRTIYCNKTVFPKCDRFFLEQVSCITITAPRSQGFFWTFVNRRCNPALRIHSHCPVSWQKWIQYFLFPILFKILFNVILPSKMSLHFLLLPSGFLIDFLNGRHMWYFRVSYKIQWRLSPCFDYLHQVWCCSNSKASLYSILIKSIASWDKQKFLIKRIISSFSALLFRQSCK
jgi:hypothetical protein